MVIRILAAVVVVMAAAGRCGKSGAQDAAAVKSNHQPTESSFLPGKSLSESLELQQNVVRQRPGDATEQFRMGIIQFLRALEGLGQDHYRYGLMSGRRMTVPLMRLPLPENPEPEALSYEDARAVVQRLLDRLNEAQQTLSAINPNGIRLPVDLATVSLDLNADGNHAKEESLLAISVAVQRVGRSTEEKVPDTFPVTFDDGDVPWLEGYCHVLAAFCEFVLAHDWRDHFERSAILFYPKAVTPYQFLYDEPQPSATNLDNHAILNIIAFLHCINYECAEPARMKSALQHLESMITCSRRSWKLIEAETDDDREWLPHSGQTSIMGSLQMTQQIVSGWKDVLDEFELILQGKKLLPFWRGIPGGRLTGQLQFNRKLGINVRRIFTEPRRFDLALWAHGSGLQAFLEEGETTSPDDWRKFNQAFGGRFWNFAFWIN